MVDERAFWRRFGPGLYWDDAVRAAHRGGLELVTREHSRVVGVDWQEFSLCKEFSLQAFARVGGEEFPASPSYFTTRARVSLGVRADTTDPRRVVSEVLDYVSCLSAAQQYFSGRGVRVRQDFGPLSSYMHRYIHCYPFAVRFCRQDNL